MVQRFTTFELARTNLNGPADLFVDRINEVVNAVNVAPNSANVLATVRQYGAIVDGVTDDTAAVQALIDSIAASGDEGAVLIDGDSLATTGLVLKTGVSLVGRSQGKSLIVALAGAAKGVLTIASGPVKRLRVADLLIQGLAANTGQWGLYFKAVADGSTTGGLWNSAIERVSVSNTKAGGVYLQGGPVGGLLPHQFLRFASCDFKYSSSAPATWIGIRVAGQVGQVDWDECESTGDTAAQNVANALYVSRYADDDGVLTGDDTHPYAHHFNVCTFQGSLLGARIDRGVGVHFTVPYFEDNKSGLLAENSSYVSISGIPVFADSCQNGSGTGYALKQTGLAIIESSHTPHVSGVADADLYQEANVGRLNVPSRHPVSGSVAADVVDGSWIGGEANVRYIRHADGKLEWSSGAAVPDTNLSRSGAGILNSDQTIQAQRFAINGTGGLGKLQFNSEQASDPAAPSANQAVMWIKDNGAGKTQLMVRFATGAIQQIAIEP